jgi:biopolymer transport protein ExbB/TolQ
MPDPERGEPSAGYETVNQSTLALSKQAAGAGLIGFLGFVGLLLGAGAFFITENFFLAMLGVSLALLVYATGAEVGKLLLSSVTVFFSSRHLTPKAAQLQQTLAALEEALTLRRDRLGELRTRPLEKRVRVRLPDNALVRDLVAVQEAGKGYDYAEYVAYSYYVDCQELYDHSASHLDFVSGAMPLFGLMGTVLGLITMFDSLGSSPSIEAIAPALALALKNTLYGAFYSSLYKISATRFEQRLKGLDYDFDTLCRALQVIFQNDAVIQVDQ